MAVTPNTLSFFCSKPCTAANTALLGSAKFYVCSPKWKKTKLAFEELFHARTVSLPLHREYKRVKAVPKPCLPFCMFAANAPPHLSARSCKLEINSSEISAFPHLSSPPCKGSQSVAANLQSQEAKKAWGHYFSIHTNSWLNKELACSLQSPLITHSPVNSVTTWKREFLPLHAVLVVPKKWHTGSPCRH